MNDLGRLFLATLAGFAMAVSAALAQETKPLAGAALDAFRLFQVVSNSPDAKDETVLEGQGKASGMVKPTTIKHKAKTFKGNLVVQVAMNEQVGENYMVIMAFEDDELHAWCDISFDGDLDRLAAGPMSVAFSMPNEEFDDLCAGAGKETPTFFEEMKMKFIDKSDDDDAADLQKEYESLLKSLAPKA